MKSYKNLLIVGDKTHYIAMTFENMYKPVQYKYFDNFSNKGQYITDTVNTLMRGTSLEGILKDITEKKN